MTEDYTNPYILNTLTREVRRWFFWQLQRFAAIVFTPFCFHGIVGMSLLLYYLLNGTLGLVDRLTSLETPSWFLRVTRFLCSVVRCHSSHTTDRWPSSWCYLPCLGGFIMTVLERLASSARFHACRFLYPLFFHFFELFENLFSPDLLATLIYSFFFFRFRLFKHM